MRSLRRLAERTPESRDRYVDLLRALALLLVVLGHWLISDIRYDSHHRLTGHSALQTISWAYPTTWLFQVIPVFFMVGGYANAASLASHRNRGEDAVAWLQERAARLVRPTTTLFLVLVTAALIARPLGVDPAEIRTAVWTASVPLWFLLAYLVVVALAPVTYALHRRFGAAVPLTMLVLVALGDVGRLTGHSKLAYGNYLFGWLLLHQVGYFWRDGKLPRGPRRALPLLICGVVALILLTVVGPYPVNMIDVADTRIKNASPPSLALLATAATQLGLIMVWYDRARGWLRHSRPWQAVIATNSVLLTIFLWHMTAALVVAGTLSEAGVLPTPRVNTSGWWLWRIPWLIMLGIVLALLVAVFGRIEARRLHRPERQPAWLPSPLRPALGSPAPRLALTLTGYAGVVIGLLINSMTSRLAHDRLGMPAGALAAYLASAALLRLLSSVPARPGPEPASTLSGQSSRTK